MSTPVEVLGRVHSKDQCLHETGASNDGLNGVARDGSATAKDFDASGQNHADPSLIGTPVLRSTGSIPIIEDGNQRIAIHGTPPTTPKQRALRPDMPSAKQSVHFHKPSLSVDEGGLGTTRPGPSVLENASPSLRERRATSFLTKLKSLTASSGGPAHTRHSSAGSAITSPGLDNQRSPNTLLGLDHGSFFLGATASHQDSDADVDESGSETGPDVSGMPDRSSGTRRHRFRRKPPQSPQTAPTTPRSTTRSGRPLYSSSQSMAPGEGIRPTMLSRRATATGNQGESSHGVSEDEGRARISRASPWRRGSSWVGGVRGSSSRGQRDDSNRPEVKRPSHLRRLTGLGQTTNVNDPPMASPWKSNRAERAKVVSTAKWRQVKAGLRMLGQRRKAENKIDHAKSAELLAELTAGAPAALMLASMFQRDEHGNRRIPILLEQLKVRITESKGGDESDRHMIFRIEMEYGNGLTRMKWVIHRALRDFANLHARYKVQIGTQKYVKLKGDDPRARLPHFPRSTFPYLRGIRGIDDSESSDMDGGGTGLSEGEASGTDRQTKKRRKARPILGSRRKSSAATVRNADGVLTQVRRDPYPERQRKKLELYLQRMIRYLIFRPESNRLCKFLELSALGVRLAAEGSYHGKEGLLMIKSGKGIDFRRAWTPSLLVGRHGPKWFSVRHSYIVCVDSPEAMNIYDVFLVDSDFRVSTKRKRIRDQQKPKDIAKVAKESAAHPQHHSLKLFNSERSMKLLARNERQLHQFQESILYMCTNSSWARPKRFDSFAPVRHNVSAQWLVDGRDYMWNASRAISMAKDVIYIHDWWLSPELYMRRPAAISQKWRLDRLLQRKAREGVKVFVIMYRNINSAIPIDSEYSKFSLLDLHPNIFVQRSPNQFRQNTFFWAHHEKLCLIDHMVAFVGGIDLCFGRWDTPQHSVVDDKLTGFEASESPKDADHCQLWPGKDYSNPRVQDFYALDKPYEEMYNRAKVPRMPWHDIHMQVVGQPARDLTRHFVQRWNYILRQRKPTRPTPFLLPPPDFDPADLKALGLDGTCEVQILRSACEWSLGTPGSVEHSILNAYIKMIEQSDHFVYIENQFFITSCEVEGTRMENTIGDALVERIIRAAQNGDDWRAVVIIPLMPGFQNTVAEQDGTSVRLIMQCQFRSICRGEASIFGRLRSAGVEPEEYIQFFSLRSWGNIGPNKQLVTEQLYIHAKCMVVDDRIAIIGSANINERSMLGSRDSECAAVVRDTDMLNSTMNGKPYAVGRFPHTLRMRLMREHLGLDVDEILETDQNADETESSVSPDDADLDGISASVYRNKNQEIDESAESLEDHENQTLLLRNEQVASFNGDVDWEQSENPNLKAGRKTTEDSRVTNNAAHRKSVDGEGHDAMNLNKVAGHEQLRDSYLQSLPNGHVESLIHASENAAHGKTSDDQLQASTCCQDSPLLTSAMSEKSPSEENAGIHGAEMPSDQDRTQMLDQAVPIGRPPIDIVRPNIDRDCMRDPLADSFMIDKWQAVAENNTKLFRQVFRCMPDNEVKSWKEYKEYVAYSERFTQAHGGGKSKDRIQQEAPGTSGPPGQSSMADRLSMLGSVGEKAGSLESRAERLGEKFLHHSHKEVDEEHVIGRVQDWAEEANKEEAARHAREAIGSTPSPGLDSINEKSSVIEDQQAILPTGQTKALPLEKQTTHGTAATGTIPTTTDGAHITHSNSMPHRRRRRTTIRNSRREFRASDDIMPKAEADEAMRHVQGHLVMWPYDWLAKEEQGGNWLYSIDGLAPLEIYT